MFNAKTITATEVRQLVIEIAVRRATNDYWRKGVITRNALGLGLLKGDQYLIDDIRAEFRKIMAGTPHQEAV